MKKASCSIWVATVLNLPLSSAFAASMVTVTNTNDDTIRDGQCTLREAAMITALADFTDCPAVVTGEAEPLVIRLQPGATYFLSNETLLIDNREFAAVEIDGQGATVRRDMASTNQFSLLQARVSHFTLRNMSLRDGQAPRAAALEATSSSNNTLTLLGVQLIGNEAVGTELGTGFGGAVSASDTHIRIEDCLFETNHADQAGGALNLNSVSGTIVGTRFVGNSSGSAGALRVANSSLQILRGTFSGNQVENFGGAIGMETNPLLAIEQSTFSDNRANSLGGAILISGPVTVRQSLFSGNTASSGGALYRGLPLAGPALIENTTFFHNRATGSGGAIWLERGVMQLVSATIVSNQAGNGGGVLVADNPATGIGVDHSLIIGNSASGNSNCGGPRQTGGGYSILGTGCSFAVRTGDITGAGNSGGSIVANELADNGGPSQTLAVNPDGPAVNAGNREYLQTTSQDQRGFARIAEGRVDIGAVEFAAEPVSAFLGVLFASSFEDEAVQRFSSRQRFLDSTGAVDASGPLPDLGNLSGQTVPLTVGTISFVAVPPSSFFFDQWTSALPDLEPMDTVDLALNNLEDFDLRTAPVTAFGFDYVDPDGDGTVFNLTACQSTFDPAAGSCPPGDVVYSTNFFATTTTRSFVGFQIPQTFRQVSIREQTNSNTNEYFGHVFTAP